MQKVRQLRQLTEEEKKLVRSAFSTRQYHSTGHGQSQKRTSS